MNQITIVADYAAVAADYATAAADYATADYASLVSQALFSSVFRKFVNSYSSKFDKVSLSIILQKAYSFIIIIIQ